MSVDDDTPVDIDEARDELTIRLDRHRDELRRGVDDLASAVHDATRSLLPMRESPGLWAVGGFVLGVWIGWGGGE
jgi:hypothetical protein